MLENVQGPPSQNKTLKSLKILSERGDDIDIFLLSAQERPLAISCQGHHSDHERTRWASGSCFCRAHLHVRKISWTLQLFLNLFFPSGVSRALLHNFAGKPSVALEGVKAGYLFSFPPAVCRNQQVRVKSHFSWALLIVLDAQMMYFTSREDGSLSFAAHH